MYMNLHIIHELSGDHDTGNEETMYVEGVNGQQWLPLSEAVEVHVGHNEARRATVGVLEDPLEVAVDGDSGPGQPMEH